MRTDVPFKSNHHVVWCPKYRRLMLVDGAPLTAIKQYIEQQKGR